jgi:hypothetical protein
VLRRTHPIALVCENCFVGKKREWFAPVLEEDTSFGLFKMTLLPHRATYPFVYSEISSTLPACLGRIWCYPNKSQDPVSSNRTLPVAPVRFDPD